MKFFILILTFIVLTKANPSGFNLDLNNICDGYLFQAISHPEDRSLFIGCVQGRGTVFACEHQNEVFDPNTITCVDESSLLTTTTEDPPLTTTARPNPCEGITGNVPHESNCTLFLTCDAGNPILSQCWPNFIFLSGECEYGDPNTCTPLTTTTSTTTTTTSTPTTTTTTTTPTTSWPTTSTTIGPTPTTTSTSQAATTTTSSGGGSSDVCFACPPSGSGVIPHTTNCSRFFECIMGVRHLRFCESGDHFDIIQRQCINAEEALCVLQMEC